jgi:hypothetical protein
VLNVKGKETNLGILAEIITKSEDLISRGKKIDCKDHRL